MPKDFLVQAAQAYIAQPTIQIGYKTRSGGVGTVNAIAMEHPIDIAQAKSSTIKRKRLDVQSYCIH
jgi:predicted NUDIX family NTP pyrophosphohydrolase